MADNCGSTSPASVVCHQFGQPRALKITNNANDVPNMKGNAMMPINPKKAQPSSDDNINATQALFTSESRRLSFQFIPMQNTCGTSVPYRSR